MWTPLGWKYAIVLILVDGTTTVEMVAAAAAAEAVVVMAVGERIQVAPGLSMRVL